MAVTGEQPLSPTLPTVPNPTRILVVEDEADIAELIKHALERTAGQDVTIVGAGDLAL